ncbi:NAD-dependent epimerase/dehydratase family protein [Micromonospora sp. NBC_01655]|uniref:NAD-dependent epimerase/dehydratase family protein n=1 Tax=Micromonospora sp. NBC_01655 TaxID=2975983 RepID=UPI002253C13E|nr:NAD-dependent epimerase/dehydratase family protein [Micromonospora sp. NBC_01655]MCX4470958.1 NAD-dependent epimerase/dehydratase family protein [Micromonospora sp. NBC_01655]
MRLLVLGGSWFVGRAVVAAALRAGWEVTTFNRGQSGPGLAGVRAIHGDRTRAGDVADLAAAGPWDAVVDTSGYVPANVLEVAAALSAAADRYVFVSTVSVYRDWPARPLSERSEVLDCPQDAGPSYGTDTEDGATRYGYLKSGCEAAVSAVFGEDRTTLLRPGVILGPREYVGRLPWWLRRVAAGGEVLAPGSPDRTIQPIDVRDVATFALCAVTDHLPGAYNVCAPIGGATFAGLLHACVAATGVTPSFTWVPHGALLDQGVRQWSELPLWRTFDGVWQVDAAKAQQAGLTCRSLAATVADTWHWLRQSGGSTHGIDRTVEIGLSPEKEARVLAAWHGSGERCG